MLWTILIVLLILMLLGAPPVTGHPYGWYPSGGIGLVVLILIILLLLGRV